MLQINFSYYNNADDTMSLNLDNLLIQIKVDITSCWYQFGQALRVDTAVLEACLHYPPEESIVEVCDNWLRNHMGQPTWREVAEALRQIHCQQLANEVELICSGAGKMNNFLHLLS